MVETLIVQWTYKLIMLFLIIIFVYNIFDKKSDVWTQIMNGFILIPFFLRLFSVR